jgi:hypothetical protein
MIREAGATPPNARGAEVAAHDEEVSVFLFRILLEKV